MRVLSILSLLTLGACSAAAEPPAPSDGLFGSRPAEALPLPDFAVLDQAGQSRGPADLRGQPHVLWFYPMAGTPG